MTLSGKPQSVVGSYADGVIAATAGNGSPVGEIDGECRLCKYFSIIVDISENMWYNKKQLRTSQSCFFV
jgi:hypothetical protein